MLRLNLHSTIKNMCVSNLSTVSSCFKSHISLLCHVVKFCITKLLAKVRVQRWLKYVWDMSSTHLWLGPKESLRLDLHPFTHTIFSWRPRWYDSMEYWGLGSFTAQNTVAKLLRKRRNKIKPCSKLLGVSLNKPFATDMQTRHIAICWLVPI